MPGLASAGLPHQVRGPRARGRGGAVEAAVLRPRVGVTLSVGGRVHRGVAGVEARVLASLLLLPLVDREACDDSFIL